MPAKERRATTAIITLLTDFGTADGYVAEVKGVLLSADPTAQLVDATHDIPARDVELGRLTLARYWRRFPQGAVHLAIIDPGVGSDRAAIAVESDGRFLVGPDNGLLSPALLLTAARTVRIPIPATATPTFHGRDVFAPVAARLAAGEPLSAVGMPFASPVVHRTVAVRVMGDGGIEGEVIAIDRFGNAITNLVSRPNAQVEVGNRRLRVVRTYADVASGTLCALAGSTGLIEIAMRDGSGASAAGLRRGSKVSLSVRQ